MISILLLLLMSTSTESQSDWCPIIKPNDTYSGLGMYWSHTNSTLKMFNRKGKEWTVTKDNTTLIPNFDSIESNVTIVYHKSNLFFNNKYYEFDVKHDQEGKEVTIHLDVNTVTSMDLNLKEYIFVRIEENLALLFKKDNITDFIAAQTKGDKNIDICDTTSNVTILGSCKKIKKRVNNVTEIIEKVTLFNSIDAIISSFKKTGVKGTQSIDYFVILYTIDGRPHYCVTTDTSLHSCNNETNLKQFFKECFSSKTSTIDMTSSDVTTGGSPTDSSSDSTLNINNWTTEESITTKRPKVLVIPNLNPPKYRYKVVNDDQDFWFSVILIVIGFIVIILTAVLHYYMESKEKQRKIAYRSRYKLEKKTPNLAQQ